MIWCSERAAKVDYLRGASAIASGPRRASPRTVIFRRVDGGVPRLRRAVEELSPREQAAVAKFLKALNSDWTTSRYRRCRTVRTARRSSGAETVMPRPRRERGSSSPEQVDILADRSAGGGAEGGGATAPLQVVDRALKQLLRLRAKLVVRRESYER